MKTLELVSSHGKGQAHRQWLNVFPTYDPWSFWIPPGGSVVEANGRSWSSPYPVIAMFWPQQYYQIFVLLKESCTEYYCNIITPPVFDPQKRCVLFQDLELDVYVTDDGAKLLDVAEFEESKMTYPKAWSIAAWGAAETLLRMGETKEGPFSGEVAQFWREGRGVLS